MDEMERILASISASDDEKAKLKELVNSGKVTMPQIKEQIERAGERQCPYCLISDGKIEAKKIRESMSFIACLEIRPANLGHVIIFPRKHAEDMRGLSKEECSELSGLIRDVSKALFSMFGGINIAVSMGPGAGQFIPHLVVNLIPRTQGDGISLMWKGKQVDEADLNNALKKIKENLPAVEEKPAEKKREISEKELPNPEAREA